MCGIVGAIAGRNILPILVAGLKRLEYRGYDSAGLAIIDQSGTLCRARRVGKVAELVKALDEKPLAGQMGIAHTRWATHGKPTKANAHPHFSNSEVAVVHNGIIENHESLKARLEKLNYRFDSDTDTEVIGHLFHHILSTVSDPLKAALQLASELEGAFALGLIDQNLPDTLIAIRRGSPLVIGVGFGENFIASDQLALLPVTQQFIYLDEGDIALLKTDSIELFDASGASVSRPIHQSEQVAETTQKGPYRHFMLKEIFEQPGAISETLENRLSQGQVLTECFGERAPEIFEQVENIQIVACGTSFHAGLLARYWIEAIAKIPTRVEVASEFRYRENCVPKNTLLITISQSGETADTLAALRKSKTQGFLASLVICNVPESSLVRESDLVFMTRAGTEIGVASTKAFTTQLVGFLLLTLNLASIKQQTVDLPDALKQLKHLPKAIEQTLQLNDAIEELALQFSDKQHALFLGRGTQYPIAKEGALKLKEISYIHAEAYPAGELKHGPLALVDDKMPVIAVAPNDELLEKLKSNLHEVHARGGRLIVFTDHPIDLSDAVITLLQMPKVGNLIAPIVYTIPLQLLAYHVAVLKGTDVDQPRNLAKSVTVE